VIEEGIRDYLLAHVTPGRLGSYDFGDGAEAAIFTVDPLPSDQCLPAIQILESGGVRFGTRARKGAQQYADVTVYGPKHRSAATLRDIAFEVWKLLERANLELRDACAVLCIADPPARFTDPDGFPGFRIAVSVTFLEAL